MKVEIEMKKKEAEALRKFLGLHTKTTPVACLKSLLRLILNDNHELEMLMYEKRNS